MPETNQTSTIHPADFGPIYRETDMSQFPVEPYSTWSNLIFVFIIAYWARKISFSTHKFLAWCLVLLALGFVGGTIYHATRSHDIWLILDFGPLGLLAATATVYFWHLIERDHNEAFHKLSKWFYLFTIVAISTVIALGGSISAGYTMIALCICFPAFIHCYLENWRSISSILLALLMFGIAITCRVYDRTFDSSLFPMGTHFLWHVFGGLSSFFVIDYLYKAVEGKATPKTSESHQSTQ
jgi:hemolysin III